MVIGGDLLLMSVLMMLLRCIWWLLLRKAWIQSNILLFFLAALHIWLSSVSLLSCLLTFAKYLLNSSVFFFVTNYFFSVLG